MNPLRKLALALLLLALILYPQIHTLTLTHTSNTGIALQAGDDWWYGTITIKEDGSVEPPDAPVTVEDDTYTLTKNVKSGGDGIIIQRDNIVIDGAGHTIEGSNTTGSKGINLTSRKNIILKNLEIQYFETGIYLWSSSNNTITGNNIANNGHGIYLSYSSNNTVARNNITGNRRTGIHFNNSSYNLIYNNVFANNVNVAVESSVNYWNIEKTRGTNIVGGPYLGGNYWSGFSENCTDSDGDMICDKPYVIDKNNVDYYPLAEPTPPTPPSTTTITVTVTVTQPPTTVTSTVTKTTTSITTTTITTSVTKTTTIVMTSVTTSVVTTTQPPTTITETITVTSAVPEYTLTVTEKPLFSEDLVALTVSIGMIMASTIIAVKLRKK